MTGTAPWRPRVVVVGTGFGRIYLAALRREGMPFELAGILARGGERSHALARHDGVPLWTDVDQVPDDVDLACVVVPAAINGGQGAAVAGALMRRGIHVLQEHPLDATELAGCLREARRSGVVYQVNTNYVHLAPVATFVAAARRLLEHQRPVLVDALTSFQVLYTLFDVLGRALGGIRPWSLTARPALPGVAGVLRSVDGVLAGVPVTLRVQNQLHRGERDNGAHVPHRITIATEGGNLLLANTQGPVLWSPRLHMPPDYADAVTVAESSAAHLDLPGTTALDARSDAGTPSYRRFLAEDWPAAAARALCELRQAVLDGTDPLPAGQYHLGLTRLVADVSGQLGRPELVDPVEPGILAAQARVVGA